MLTVCSHSACFWDSVLIKGLFVWFTLMSTPLEVDVSVRNLGDYYKLMAEFFFFFFWVILLLVLFFKSEKLCILILLSLIQVEDE